MPAEDGIIDLSNPAAQEWYRGLLSGLLKLQRRRDQGRLRRGCAARAACTHPAAPVGTSTICIRCATTSSSPTSPTKRTGEHIIWARSAWAGSQRYPLHWGGDAENTDSAMAATLRAGLSFGLCGFTYWSHDAGGFVGKAPRDLYRRWLPFSALSSHTRCHGARRASRGSTTKSSTTTSAARSNMRVPAIALHLRRGTAQLGPRLSAGARRCSSSSTTDPTSWLIEDEYMFGSKLLVAPLFTEGDARSVYLPPGQWIDFQSGQTYEGGKWHKIAAGPVPIVVLVRGGSAIPLAKVAQSTGDIDWEDLELCVFSIRDEPITGHVALPDGKVHDVEVLRDAGGKYQLDKNPLAADIHWRVTSQTEE